MTVKYESMMINTAIFELYVPLIPSFIMKYFTTLTPRSFSKIYFSIKAPLSFLYSMYKVTRYLLFTKTMPFEDT